MPDCIFCKIVAGTIPSFKVYEDEKIIAFLDIHPIHSGHTLVVSKKHYADFLEADATTLAHISAATQHIAKAVKMAMNADGCNIASNVGTAAGQSVFHLHWHVIPRFALDGLTPWPQKEYKEGEAKATQEVIIKSL